MNTIRQLFSLCFGRSDPVNLPYSWRWLLLFVFFNFLNHFSFFVSQVPLWQAIGLSLFSLLSEGLMLYVLLWTRAKQNRFVKLAIALLGTHMMQSGLFQILLSLPWGSLSTGLVLFCSIWALAVTTYIFRQGLEVSKVKAILIAISFECLATILMMPYIGEIL